MTGLRVVGLPALPLHRPAARDRARDGRCLRGRRAPNRNDGAPCGDDAELVPARSGVRVLGGRAAAPRLGVVVDAPLGGRLPRRLHGERGRLLPRHRPPRPPRRGLEGRGAEDLGGKGVARPAARGREPPLRAPRRDDRLRARRRRLRFLPAASRLGALDRRPRARRRLGGAGACGRPPPAARTAAAPLRRRLPRRRSGAAAHAGARARDPARDVDRARGRRLPAAPRAAPRRERSRRAPLHARHGAREHGAAPARERGHLPGRGPRRARARPQGRRARGRGQPARPGRRQRRGRHGRARRARALRPARRRALAGGATVRRLSAAGFLSAPARQAASLRETAHRPWPLPPGSWRMGQTWEDLLFAHWRVDADALRPLVPEALRLHTHDGAAWLGITPFKISALRLRGTLPLPRVSSFLQLNVRTYVTAGGKPGIWFFSLDASSRLAVEAARRSYKLPYFQARIRAEPGEDWIEVESARVGHVFSARYRASGEEFHAPPGSLEEFLAERYCLYAVDERGRLYRAEIHHPPWPLQPAEAAIELNT